MNDVISKDRGGLPSVLELPVDGLHCAGCVTSVERALTEVEGVQEASVSLAEGSARVKVDPGSVEVTALTEKSFKHVTRSRKVCKNRKQPK